jgi:hypothetical protein
MVLRARPSRTKAKKCRSEREEERERGREEGREGGREGGREDRIITLLVT